MRKIVKGTEPESLTRWIKRKPEDKNENQWFSAMYDEPQRRTASELRKHNTQEQYYLCAYCCKRISGESTDTTNEHVIARSLEEKRSLEYTNIVASCSTKRQCDKAHGNHKLPLTPLMDECETELKFMISGRVKGLSDRATESIRVLNLGDHERNNKALIEMRKQLTHILILTHEIDSSDDHELLNLVIDDLLTPKDGKLEPFAPVVANILRGWIEA